MPVPWALRRNTYWISGIGRMTTMEAFDVFFGSEIQHEQFGNEFSGLMKAIEIIFPTCRDGARGGTMATGSI